MQGLNISIRLRQKTMKMYLTPENCNEQLAQLIVQQRLSLEQATQIKDTIIRDVKIMHKECQRQLQRSQQYETGLKQAQTYSLNVIQPKYGHKEGSVKQKEDLGSDIQERDQPIKYQHKHTSSYSHSVKYPKVIEQSKLEETSHKMPCHNQSRRAECNPESQSNQKYVLLKDLKTNGDESTSNVKRYNINSNQVLQSSNRYVSKSRKVPKLNQGVPLNSTLKASKSESTHFSESKSRSKTKPIQPKAQLRLQATKKADRSKAFCLSRQILETNQSREKQQKKRERQIRKTSKTPQLQCKPDKDKSCEAHKCEVWRDKMTPKVEEQYSFHPKINHYPSPTPYKHGTITKKLLHPDLGQFYSKFQREAARFIQS